jgi:hypothetical protein
MDGVEEGSRTRRILHSSYPISGVIEYMPEKTVSRGRRSQADSSEILG